MTTVDILIPHYNDIVGLKLSIESINTQTWKGKFRIVVCDDGSEKENLAEVQKLALTDNRIVLKVNEENKGRPYTRNVLLDLIESKYVTWLDAGDEWYADKISQQFKAYYRSQFKYEEDHIWVTCNYDWQWIGKKRSIRYQNIKGDQVKSLMIGAELRSYLWTLFGTADAFRSVGKFDESLPRLQDLDYFIRFSAKGGRIINSFEDKPLCVYHKSDIGRDAKEIRSCYYHIYHKHAHLYNKYSTTFRKNRKFEIERHTARFAASNNDLLLKYQYVLKSFLIDPIGFVFRIVKMRGIKL